MQYIKRKNSILFWIINILLIFNIFKIYDLGISNDKIRLLCYGFLAINFPVCILRTLTRKDLKISNGLSIHIGIYMILVAVRLILGGELQWDIWLNCFLVPGVIIECCIEFKDVNVRKILVYEEIIAYILIILFMYNKIFLHQAGAGKLNSIFYVLLLMPVVLCINNNNRNILVLLIAICSIISLKRTALIIFILCYSIFMVSENKTSIKKMIKILISIVVFVMMIYWIQAKFGIDMMSKVKNMAEDGGSGRSDIYLTLIENFFNRSFNEILFGGGTNSVINIVGGTAHNDFFEIVYDFGILIFLVYLAIYVFLIKKYIKMRKVNYKLKTQFLISIICFFIMSTLSHVIMIPTYILHFAIFWGIILNDFFKFKVYRKVLFSSFGKRYSSRERKNIYY